MARPLQEAKPGKLVYLYGSPSKVGIILPMPRGYPWVRIVWINTGEVTEHGAIGLQDFMGLIEETEKKLSTHTATLQKAATFLSTWNPVP